MPEPAINPKLVRFGLFELDLEARELRKSGVKIRLQEKPFQILAMLVERPGKIVSREELQKRLWPADTFVDFDLGLNSAVRKLRESLADDSENPRFIETLYRRGYRFIGTVSTPGPGKPEQVPELGPREVAAVLTETPASHHPPEMRTAGAGRSRWLWITPALLVVIAFGVVLAWFARPLPPPRVLGTSQITNDGFTKTGAVTDGSRMYITESKGSRPFLIQVSVTGGDASIIPTPFANIGVFGISPDHSQLFVFDTVGSESECQAWVLPLPSGAPRRLGNIRARRDGWGCWLALSPDGQQIAFVKGSEIYMASLDGTSVQKLVTLSGYANEMTFSPDGTRLRFTLRNLQNNSSSSIWEVHTDGTGLHPVLPGWHNPPSELAGGWSPDGRYYYCMFCDPGAGCSLWAIREPRGLFRRDASPPVQLTTGPMSVFLNGIGPEGKRLFVGGWTVGRGKLVRYDTHSHQFVPFLNGLDADELDFSRDGQWVTYTSNGVLWRSRLDGSERLQLTSPPVLPCLPHWSPDDTQIAYVNQAGSLWKIFLISAQGGIPQEVLSENQYQLDPTWSPDGNRIAFGRVPWLRASTEKIAIEILDLSSKLVSAIPGSEDLFSPRWSPDGRYLAAVSADSKRLVLFDFSTKKWADWISEPGTVGYPAWSKDGKYLYYDNVSMKKPSYRRVKLGQTRSEFLFDLGDLRRRVRPNLTPMGPWGGLAPDGSALFVREEGSDEFYALDMELP